MTFKKAARSAKRMRKQSRRPHSVQHFVDGTIKLVDLEVQADVAKLVDARDLKSLGLGCTGSTPVVRTKQRLSV
jgi:hypothetical protein